MDDHSLLAAVTAGVLQAAVSLGMDRATLVSEAGLDEPRLADPDARIPVLHEVRLWEVLSRRPIGLAIGERLGMAALGVVGYAMHHGATVGEALEWLQRYRAVLHPDLVPRLERRRGPEGERVVFAKVVPMPFARLGEPVYAQAAATLASMRALAGSHEVRARSVTFPMPRPRDPSPQERYFACPVAWGAPEFEIAFDASLLSRRIPRSDPHLFSYLARRADELLAQLPDEERVSSRARREIGAVLASGEPRLAAVARRLAMSERTLHRRLAAEGTTFATLVDSARRERASLLLDDPRLSCSEVAFLLGYAEPATFFRAFKRWTGETPQRWRAARRAPSSSSSV
jgi:AraC-like DNA-binding protein